ncbi:MAG: hypothetical protein JSR15_06990, partial [Proteobacteria bacterium]|nr:hypothetical protein [Pseudomonadota bacterium]
GLVVPPIAAVYLVDFFVLRRTDYSSPGAGGAHGHTNVNALLAFAFGAAVGCGLYLGKVSLTGVPTIEAFFAAASSYWALEQWRGARSRAAAGT